jgi:hypothetical protein
MDTAAPFEVGASGDAENILALELAEFASIPDIWRFPI